MFLAWMGGISLFKVSNFKINDFKFETLFFFVQEVTLFSVTLVLLALLKTNVIVLKFGQENHHCN